uniref:Uncharacterized protein n=1 Tax=Arundo donax TaxID=35708 RepID=A0A0A8ZJL2_ARUDO
MSDTCSAAACWRATPFACSRSARNSCLESVALAASAAGEAKR